MAIQILDAPTFASISEEIRNLEQRYGLSTEQFLTKCDYSMIDEDDSMQWEYLHEQVVALQAAAVQSLYADSGTKRNTLLKNVYTPPETLAA